MVSIVVCIIVFFFAGIAPAQANISSEINSLLNSIFGDKEVLPDFTPIEIEPIVIPANPTTDDWIAFTQRMADEETNLLQFSAKMVDLQAEIYEIAQQQKGLERELIILDGELSLAQKNLARLSQQEQAWKKELNIRNAELKRLRSEQKDTILIYKTFLQTHQLRKNRLTSDATVDMVQWLLGARSVAEIQEENFIRQQFAAQQENYLGELNRIGNQIGSKQRIADNLYQKIAPLKEQAASQRETLTDLAQSKARRRQSQSATLNQKKSQLYALEREHAQTKLFLQNLKNTGKTLAQQEPDEAVAPSTTRQNQTISTPITKTIPAKLIPKKIRAATSTPSDQVWQSPLKIPLKVTATFGDQSYEALFDREHLGVDFLAPQGTPIHAPKSGTIVKTSLTGNDYGYIIIDHGDDIYSLYGHVSAIFIDEGDYLVQGQKLALTGGAPGTIGAGPWSTGAHLHLEIFEGDEHVDPVEFMQLLTND